MPGGVSRSAAVAVWMSTKRPGDPPAARGCVEGCAGTVSRSPSCSRRARLSPRRSTSAVTPPAPWIASSTREPRTTRYSPGRMTSAPTRTKGSPGRGGSTNRTGGDSRRMTSSNPPPPKGGAHFQCRDPPPPRPFPPPTAPPLQPTLLYHADPQPPGGRAGWERAAASEAGEPGGVPAGVRERLSRYRTFLGLQDFTYWSILGYI